MARGLREIAVNNDTNTTTRGGGTSGTLATQGFYRNPSIPTNSQASGLQGSDGRGYTRTVGPDQLVREQVNTLTESNNPYLANARRRGVEQANRRGLMNSSIAAGTGERAALEQALPIAMADAATHDRAQSENLQSMNANLMQERQVMNDMTSAELNRQAANANAAVGMAEAAARRELDLQMQRERLAFDGEQQGLSRQQQEMLSRLGYDQQSSLMDRGYGHDLGRMGAGYGYDIGRMGAGFQFDIGRMNNQAYITDWLQDNQFQRGFMQDLVMLGAANTIAREQNLWGRVLDEPEVYGDPQLLARLQQSSLSLFTGLDSIFNRFFGGRG